MLTGNTVIRWMPQSDSKLLLIGKAALDDDGASSIGGGGGYHSIINPNWDFNQMGIGGLDKEFSAIFRRTFASRMFPPAVAKQLGLYNSLLISGIVMLTNGEIFSFSCSTHDLSNICALK